MPMEFYRFKKNIFFKPKRVLLFLFSCFYLSSFSQSATPVTGVVVDEKNVPVSGASIQVKNTNNGVTADSSGKFSIRVPARSVILVITHIGYKAKETSIPESGEITVQLLSENNTLNDVVVVGYGTQRRTSVTAA